jgi:hypothetical protein
MSIISYIGQGFNLRGNNSMLKKLFLFLMVFSFAVWAQNDEDMDSSEDVDTEEVSEEETEEEDVEEDAPSVAAGSNYNEHLSRKKFEEDQRADEFANALRRRDWLKDRLILQVGMGSRMPVMGETGIGMGFGAGVEYITRWHLAAYASIGMVPSGIDNYFEDINLQDGMGWKFGLNYYLFAKNAIHLGFSASYGTVHFDHDVVADENNNMLRSIIMLEGYQFDILVTYLTSEWYYLQFAFGFYYAPTAQNDDVSFRTKSTTSFELVSRVVNPDGIPEYGLVFGITLGFGFPEFFPDDTEKRRRAREKERSNAQQKAW